ncbi:neuronal acetylcholine receptor subunit alpha-2-like [Argopecten irradians]|uniref:neuronal acetylcholine receptor subunit alpha-2-like n=1 Tax=Argopecten irradians TaxID=31199 RepID=UPI00372209ED
MSGSNLLLRVTSQGHVTWEPPGLYNTHCSVDTTWFPFDVQTCSITISGWPYNVEDIRIRNNASQILTNDYHTNGEWQLYHTYISSLSTNGRNFLSFVMTLERRYEFYVMNVIVPILLTSLLTPMVFKLPSESGERISFILTVVLALEVLLTVVSTHMPATSLHTSVMEVYLVVVLTISGLAVILTALVLKLYHKGNDTELPTVIRWALRLYRQLRRGTKVKTKAQDQGMDGTDSLSSNDVTEEPIPGNNEKLTNNYMLDGFDKIDADKANKRITCRSLSLILDDVLFWLFFTLTLSCTFIFMLTMAFGGS